jgi:O-antigen/teichoic acid export membrane protein
MHALARHSIVNLIAFSLSRMIGLVIVSLVVGQYGLAAFGLIMLVRVFLPGQLFVIFDLALPEVVIRATAQGLARNQTAEAARLYLAAQIVATAIGTLLALPLILAPGLVTQWVFNLDDDYAAELAPAVLAHGAALPLLFAANIASAGLKGQEAFRALRAVDVTTTLLYGVAAVLLIESDAGIVAIALAYLGSQALKALVALFLARRGFGKHHRGVRPDFHSLFADKAYHRALIARRFGAMATSQLPRIAISYVLGPAAVGLFEAVLRLPRFLKSVVALCHVGVMPVVVRLKLAGRKDELTTIALQGPRILLALASLAVLPTVCLSQPLLALWLGPEVEPYWAWLAVLCVLPLMSATVGFWNAMGKAEASFVRKQNRVALVQGLLTAAVALPLLGTLGAAAFWLGAVCGMAYGAPAFLAINAQRFEVPAMRLLLPLLWVVLASLPAAAVGVALQYWVQLDNWPRLLSAFALVSAVQAAMLACFIVRPEERRSLLRLGRS